MNTESLSPISELVFPSGQCNVSINIKVRKCNKTQKSALKTAGTVSYYVPNDVTMILS